ncbi:MAG: hypothetical protein C4534_08510 [Gaiellales bacterium]|nr:MAG: hypothetical protein C4534_08510 [Gaiellales bacterium]
MGSRKQYRQIRQGLRVGILAIALVACAWLVPAGSGVAASSGSEFTVTVTVQDAIAVDMAADVYHLTQTDDVDVEFIAGAGSAVGGTDSSHSELVVTVSRL